MHPFIDLGFVRLRSFGVVSVIALFAAVAFAERRARARGLARWTMIGGGLYVMGGAWLGARLVPMIVDPETAFASAERFIAGFFLTAGAFYGGLAGGTAGLLLFARRRRLPRALLFDVVAPPLMLSQAVGRWACLLAGCDYGGDAAGIPWAVTYSDPASLVPSSRLGVPLHPVQVYESAGCLLVLAAILLLERRRRASAPGGATFLAAIGAYAGLRFGVEFFRGDAGRGLFLGGRISTSQILSIAAAAIVAAVALRTRAARCAAAALVLAAAAIGPASAQDSPAAGQGDFERAVAELASDDFPTRERATRVLREAGEAARGALEAAAKSADPETRHRAEAILVALRWRAAVPPSIAARLPDFASRLMEARGEELSRLLRDLHVVGAREAIPALRLLAADEGRMAGLEDALARLPLDERLAFQSAIAAYAIPEAEDVITALAGGKNTILRRGAVDALALLRTESSLAALEKLANHADPETAAAAIRALERTRRPSGVAPLAALAADAREPVAKRSEAIRALAARGERSAVPALLPLLRDPAVDREAAAALGALRAEEAVAPLLDALGPPDDAAIRDRHLLSLARCGGDSVAAFLDLVLGSRLASDTTKAAIFGGLGETRSPAIARRALDEIAKKDSSDFLVVEAVPLTSGLPDADVTPVLARRLAGATEAARVLAFALADRGNAGRAALREAAAREENRAASLAALATVAEAPDRGLALRHELSGDAAVRGAALWLLAASDRDGAREKVVDGIAGLRRGRGSFRPGLPDALRALGACRRAADAAAILEVARAEASLSVAIGALEALAEIGDRAAFALLVEEKGSPLRVVAAEVIARRDWREEANLVLPLLDGGELATIDARARGLEPRLAGALAPREAALSALETLFPDAPAGGIDPASRAAAWKRYIASREAGGDGR